MAITQIVNQWDNTLTLIATDDTSWKQILSTTLQISANTLDILDNSIANVTLELTSKQAHTFQRQFIDIQKQLQDILTFK